MRTAGTTLCAFHARQVAKDQVRPSGLCAPVSEWDGGFGRVRCDVIANPHRVREYLHRFASPALTPMVKALRENAAIVGLMTDHGIAEPHQVVTTVNPDHPGGS